MGTFWKSQKLIPSKKNQSALIAKISSPKTQKNAKRPKKNSCKNFLAHGTSEFLFGILDSASWVKLSDFHCFFYRFVYLH